MELIAWVYLNPSTTWSRPWKAYTVFGYMRLTGAVVVVISVHITTKVVSLNPGNDDVYSIQHYVICERSVVYSGFLHQ